MVLGRGSLARWLAGVAILSATACQALAVASPALGTTGPAGHAGGAAAMASPRFVGANADPARTSWFADEGALSPSVVNAHDFGERFSRQLKGEILAEPLLSDGVLLAVTEQNWAYGLNPSTGAVEWSVDYGPPQPSSTISGVCGDITPSIGITATPVIDPASDIAYFTTDVYENGAPTIELQAVHVANGASVVGFPVAIEGAASDSPTETFIAADQLQRAGLALVNGVVYAGFGSHCDVGKWLGWVVGVSTTGHITDMWSDEASPSDGGSAGIWQSGGGIVVDPAGDLYLATGNGGEPNPGPAVVNPQPGGLGNCVVELSTTGGNLRLKDYFCPYDAQLETDNDWDLGSGGPVLLPSSFGTAKDPHLLLEGGKEGEVYLLDADHLGGMTTQPPDDVVQELGPFGGVWSKPALWPGEGGYVYLPTASSGSTTHAGGGELDVYQRFVDASNDVSLEQIGSVPNFGFGSSSPIVTSDGTRPGSAIVWVVHFPTSKPVGAGARLNAYAADPVAGAPGKGATLRLLFSAPVGTGSTFNPPVASGSNVYVGTDDGDILCFGVRPGSPHLEGNAVAAADTFLGSSSRTAAYFRATGATTVENVTVDNTTTGAASAFSAASQSLPITLHAGQYFVVPLTFEPEVLGGQGATITVTTNHGVVSVPVTGQGLSDTNGSIVASPRAVRFGSVEIGGAQAHEQLTFTNHSSSSVQLTDLVLPRGPFSLEGTAQLPAALAPGASTRMTVVFTPPATSGDFPHVFTADVTLETSTAGDVEVPIEAIALPPGILAVGTNDVSFGRVASGESRIASFTVGNAGALPIRITVSRPPTTSGFSAVTRLPVGRWIAPHTTLTEIVRFRPSRRGAAAATWRIGDGTTNETVTIKGTGAKLHKLPGLGTKGWQTNGSARFVASGVRLTGTAAKSRGSAFWAHPIPSNDLSVSFTEEMGGGSGGEGMTLTLANAAKASPRSLGGSGPALGFGGIAGVAVALSTEAAGADRSNNSIGLLTAHSSITAPRWQVIDSAIPDLRQRPHVIEVTVRDHTLSVSVDGTAAFSVATNVAPMIYLGFTASTGRATDVHEALHVQVADPG